jgi:hypothetical protein
VEKRGRGKPLRLNRNVIAEIAGYIRAGCSRAAAAKKARFSKRTLRKWNKKGREGAGGIFGEVWHAVVAAEKARDTKPEPPTERKPLPQPEIVDATIRITKDGSFDRIPCDVSYDELKWLQAVCQISLSRGGTLSGTSTKVYKYCPLPDAQLTPSQQNLVEQLLNVTLRNHRGETENQEYRPR